MDGFDISNVYSRKYETTRNKVSTTFRLSINNINGNKTVLNWTIVLRFNGFNCSHNDLSINFVLR